MVDCNVCLGDYDVLIEIDGLLFCSIECHEVAKANPESFKLALEKGIALL